MRTSESAGKGQVEGDGFTRQLKAIREYGSGTSDQDCRTSTVRKVSAARRIPRIGRRGLSDDRVALQWRPAVVIIEKLDRARAEDLNGPGNHHRRTFVTNGFEVPAVAEPDLMAKQIPRASWFAMMARLRSMRSLRSF